jgi:hypothetical protein
VDVVATSTDARRLAGAIAVLGGETGSGPVDPAVLAALVGIARRDPRLAAEVGAYEAHDRTFPVAHVALALALAGEAGRVPALLAGTTPVGAGAAVDLVRRRLPAAGMGDVAQDDRFLDAAFQGLVTARDAGEAARRALEAGLPWIARLEARRGLFLDATDPASRAALVASAVALGLGATARREAQGVVELPASVPATDDEKAAAADALLREGAFGKRLVWRVEAGTSTAGGLVPLAIGGGLLAFGNTIGVVAVVPVQTGERRFAAYSGSRGLPRSVALSGPLLAAVSSRGDLVVWRVGERDLTYERLTAEEGRLGPWALVAPAATAGEFLLATRDGRLFVLAGDEEPRPLPTPASPEKGVPETLALLEGGAALLGRGRRAERVDLATGAVTTVVEADGPVTVAPFGADVLVARGSRWERRGGDGAARATFDVPLGDVLVGIAGDPAAGVAFLAFPDGVSAVSVSDGTPRWAEAVEASGSPVLGGGFLVVPAGRGRDGDGRRDRTLSALRPGPPGFDPFDEATRARLLAVAKTAVKEGRLEVASLLLAPVLDSLSPEQREEAERALAPEGTPPPPGGAEEPEGGR